MWNVLLIYRKIIYDCINLTEYSLGSSPPVDKQAQTMNTLLQFSIYSVNLLCIYISVSER